MNSENQGGKTSKSCHEEMTPQHVAGLGSPASLGASWNPYLDRDNTIEKTHGHLPHWHQYSKLQFVTFRLADSLPQTKLIQLKEEKQQFESLHPHPWDKVTEDEYYNLFGSKIDQWLDAGHGACVLQHSGVRKIVGDTILHFDEDKYIIHSFVIMPNHVHVLLELLDENKVDEILRSWKGYTSRKINRYIGRRGTLWQAEYFDRILRDYTHYVRVQYYIENNPKHLPPNTFTLYSRRQDFQVLP